MLIVDGGVQEVVMRVNSNTLVPVAYLKRVDDLEAARIQLIDEILVRLWVPQIHCKKLNSFLSSTDFLIFENARHPATSM